MFNDLFYNHAVEGVAYDATRRTLTFNVAGIAKADLSVKVADGILTIAGTTDTNRVAYAVRVGGTATKYAAKYTHGLLTVQLGSDQLSTTISID